MKPRVGVFSLTSCEGCSLAILELEDQLLQILDAVEIVNFREGMTEREWSLDVAFVDGAVSTPQDEAEVKHIRENCTTLVAIGACACLGGVNTLKNHMDPADVRSCVYGERYGWFPTDAARPLSAVVKVDAELPGCPMIKEEFVRFVQCALAGRPWKLPEQAVCVECKMRGNLCLYERGKMCLGPMIRGGCAAICPSFGSACDGCRGVLSEEALAAGAINLRDQYDVPLERLLASLRTFGAHQKSTVP